MAPRKPKVAKVLPPLPAATSPFTLNQGFYRGLSDNPPQYGQIPVPSGAAGCLAGLTFVVTGTLPSLRREEAKSLIEKYGGKVTGSISGRTDIVIRGCVEVGPKKLADAQARGIPVIDQEGLFAVIAASAPAQQTQQKQQTQQMPRAPDDTLPAALRPRSDLLAERYRPRRAADLIGNAGPVNQLRQWLERFPRGGKRIALLCGRPGIGKTTAAALVAAQCGYGVNELNASDARSRAALAELSGATDSLTFRGGALGKTLLLFDEVDGMSSGDRGGVQALAALAKTTKVPIVCTCNSVNDRRFDPLLNASLVVTFFEPPVDEIVERLRFISREEGMDVPEEALRSIALESRGDIRYCINNLQYWRGGTGGRAGKNAEVGDVLAAALKVFSRDATLDEKFDAFFYDYAMVPMYVEENMNAEDRHAWAEQLDNISIGDEIENTIRETNNWGLLNAKCVVSCLIPSTCTDPKVPIYSLLIPKMFGFNAKQTKLLRYISEIANHFHEKSVVLPNDVHDLFGELIVSLFENKMKRNGKETIINFLESLSLTLDDLEHLKELVDFKSAPAKSTATSKKYETLLKELGKMYKKMHTIPKKVESLSEMRSDYLYVKTGETKKRNTRTKKSK